MQNRRNALPVIILLVLLAACGGEDVAPRATTVATGDGSAATATSTSDAASTTTMGPATTSTTAAPTTTTAAPTTTTAAPTSTAAPVTAEGAQARAAAKVDAAVAVLPEGWIAEIAQGATGSTETDEVFGPCSGPDAFDLSLLDDVSLGIADADIESPNAASFFGPPQASIEARIFESPAVAAEAFAVLERVLGTEEGRKCMAEEFLAQMSGAADGEETAFAIEDVVVPGADVAARLVFEFATDEISFSIRIDLAASLAGDCTVFASYISFGEDFDDALRDATFAAAVDA